MQLNQAAQLEIISSDMSYDLWSLYALMKRSRLFEQAIARLWEQGLISGEMHLGTGEEAVLAGVVSQLLPEDAMAVDHRGTAAFLMRGVDPVMLLREMLGKPDGLCGGQGGHMHLFSHEHLAASSGVAGAVGPTAAGFALAAQYLRQGGIAVAFFGEGAMNQGMLMESLNLAAVWNLPVLFVCKDDGWAITSRPDESTGGSLDERVRGLGVHYLEADGLDVEAVWRGAHQAIEHARSGKGPAFLHASCVHLEGHFLGSPLLQVVRSPFIELPRLLGPFLRSLLRPGGGSMYQRLEGVRYVLSMLLATRREAQRFPSDDPLARARSRLASEPGRLEELEDRITGEVKAALASALQEVGE